MTHELISVGRVFTGVSDSGREHAGAAATSNVDGASTDGGLSTYLACWEGNLTRRTGGDVSNLVIEIRTTLPSAKSSPSSALSTSSPMPRMSADVAAISEPLLIPLPPALWSGLSGLIGLGVVGAYRRTTRRARW